MEKLKIIYKNVDELTPYANNPRNNDMAVDSVAKSIKEFGFKVPIIIDGDGEIVAGHTRLKASKKLGLKEVPCIVASDLTPEQVKAFRLADNKVSEFANWDLDLLNIELEELKDNSLDFAMDEFGFEIDLHDENEIIEDDFNCELEEETDIKQGDIFQLGRHRLMCGDSTNRKDVQKLMGDNQADLLLTDPPYNIDYKELSKDRKIKNDKMSDEEFLNFLKKTIIKCPTAYVFCSWQYVHIFKKAMEELGMAPKAMIVWDKVNPAQNLDKYYKRHELILYYGKFGGEKTIRGDVWELKRQKNTVHPTMKPLELIGMILQDNPEAKNVVDVFGGSGTTLLACEELGRKCYMMEYEPKYCDVIIKRWEEFTGEKAEKINE